jgi:hypothetical protein
MMHLNFFDEELKTRPSNFYSKQQEARGLSIYASPSGDAYCSQEHFMVSLKKALGQRLVLFGKTRRNKKASKINHTVLGGLWDIVPGYPARKGEDLVRLGIS